MKTTVKFNKGNQSVEVSNFEILKRTENRELKNYLLVRESYADFCNNQTKSGQARKNERAIVRRRMFEGIDTDSLDKEILEISRRIKSEKNALIEKITVEIEYDGRKSSNLSKIIDGVKMAVFTGGISSQYYGLGLIDFSNKIIMAQNQNQNEQWKLLVVELKKIAKKKGIEQVQIAKQTGLIQSNVSRFFSLKYKPNLDTFLKVAKALNVKLIIKE